MTARCSTGSLFNWIVVGLVEAGAGGGLGAESGSGLLPGKDNCPVAVPGRSAARVMVVENTHKNFAEFIPITSDYFI
jgi:hypothetical protein